MWRVGACSNDGGPSDGNNIFNGIMLRFRPIAPKPVTGVSPTSQSNNAASLPGKRTKRRYVRIRRNNRYVRKNNGKNSSEKVAETERTVTDELENVAVVTLQLMPEKDTPEGSSLGGDSWCKNVDLDLTVEKIQILDDPKQQQRENAVKCLDLMTTAEKTAAVESYVTVESVTGTCMGEELVGSTDTEKVKNLEADTCPCFVSDGYSNVRWVNDAYKRMVVNDEEEEREVVVWLKVKESIAWCYSYPAFTCGVRLQYTWRNEKCTKMVPCDVWKLDCGGFAWKLDVKAALSLGL